MVESLSEESDTELVEKTFFHLLLQNYLFPMLFEPIDRLDTFLRENSHLFTLIGVFGAVSIYLRTVDENTRDTAELTGEFALVTGFAIVLLLSFLILAKCLRKMRKSKSGLVSFDNLALGIFSLFFTVLMLAIGGLLSQFPTVWAFYGFLVVYVASIVSVFLSILSITNILEIVRSRVGINETIFGTITFLPLTIVLFIIIGSTEIVRPEMINEVADGGTPQQWATIYASITIILFTFFSLVLSLLFLIGTLLGIVLLAVLSLKNGFNWLHNVAKR